MKVLNDVRERFENVILFGSVGGLINNVLGEHRAALALDEDAILDYRVDKCTGVLLGEIASVLKRTGELAEGCEINGVGDLTPKRGVGLAFRHGYSPLCSRSIRDIDSRGTTLTVPELLPGRSGDTRIGRSRSPADPAVVSVEYA